jgi:hypothetical protein
MLFYQHIIIINVMKNSILMLIRYIIALCARLYITWKCESIAWHLLLFACTLRTNGKKREISLHFNHESNSFSILTCLMFLLLLHFMPNKWNKFAQKSLHYLTAKEINFLFISIPIVFIQFLWVIFHSSISLTHHAYRNR